MIQLLPGEKALAWAWVFTIVLTSQPAVCAVDGDKRSPSNSQSQPYSPPVAPASDQAKRAIRSFRVPSGLTVELFAAEPLLANPVAFCIDEKGVVYVAETFRLNAGVTDTRGHMNWLDDDLACRTVADRVAMYKKYLGKGFAAYNVQHERVRRIVDRDGDGRADAATVFADGFNDPAAGIGAGVLAQRTTSGTPAFPGSGSSAIPTATAGPTSARSCMKGMAFTSAFWATTCTACGSGPTAGSISASATEDST